MLKLNLNFNPRLKSPLLPGMPIRAAKLPIFGVRANFPAPPPLEAFTKHVTEEPLVTLSHDHPRCSLAPARLPSPASACPPPPSPDPTLPATVYTSDQPPSPTEATRTAIPLRPVPTAFDMAAVGGGPPTCARTPRPAPEGRPGWHSRARLPAFQDAHQKEQTLQRKTTPGTKHPFSLQGKRLFK